MKRNTHRLIALLVTVMIAFSMVLSAQANESLSLEDRIINFSKE